MGRAKFSIGGGSRKASKAEVARFLPKTREARSRITLEALQDIAKAQALYDAQDWDRCEPIIQRLLKHGFAQPLTYDALGSVAQFQGRIDYALKCYRKAIEIDPDYSEARNRIIMILDATPGKESEARAARKAWWKRHGAPLYANRQPHLNDRDPERPIRVGYLGADFQFHSASTVFHRIITQHTEAVQAFVYSSTPHSKWDTVTNTYRVMPGWRDVSDWPDALVVSKIRADAIDILVDLSNFTHHSRFQTLAFKPAPIQLSGWGYALATGFPCMDGLLTDRIVNPTREDWQEPMVYLPSLIDYQPIEDLPEPMPVTSARPTFGVFQRALKLNTENLGVYAEILRRVPHGRLIFKSHYSPSLQQWIREQLGDVNDRVEIRGATSSYEHKAQLLDCDLCLDTWPQPGGVSSCDVLHMGLPFVTLMNERPIQRIGGSLLTNVGCAGFIAHSIPEYIEKAVTAVTQRTDALAYHRRTLRQRLAESPICAGYLDATEAVYRALWRDWCARPLSIADAQYRLEQAS